MSLITNQKLFLLIILFTFIPIYLSISKEEILLKKLNLPKIQYINKEYNKFIEELPFGIISDGINFKFFTPNISKDDYIITNSNRFDIENIFTNDRVINELKIEELFTYILCKISNNKNSYIHTILESLSNYRKENPTLHPHLWEKDQINMLKPSIIYDLVNEDINKLKNSLKNVNRILKEIGEFKLLLEDDWIYYSLIVRSSLNYFNDKWNLVLFWDQFKRSDQHGFIMGFKDNSVIFIADKDYKEGDEVVIRLDPELNTTNSNINQIIKYGRFVDDIETPQTIIKYKENFKDRKMKLFFKKSIDEYYKTDKDGFIRLRLFYRKLSVHLFKVLCFNMLTFDEIYKDEVIDEGHHLTSAEVNDKLNDYLKIENNKKKILIYYFQFITEKLKLYPNTIQMNLDILNASPIIKNQIPKRHLLITKLHFEEQKILNSQLELLAEEING